MRRKLEALSLKPTSSVSPSKNRVSITSRFPNPQALFPDSGRPRPLAPSTARRARSKILATNNPLTVVQYLVETTADLKKLASSGRILPLSIRSNWVILEMLQKQNF